MKGLISIAFALGCAMGCANDRDGKLLREATVEDWKELCSFFNEHLWVETVCEIDLETVIVEAPEPSNCSHFDEVNQGAPDSCDATIGDLKDCWAAIEAAPCAVASETFPPECAVLFSTACTGESGRELTGARFGVTIPSSASPTL